MSAHLTLSFRRMGAEIALQESRGRFAIDIQNTKEGERFLISGRDLPREDIKILDIDPSERHLLLLYRERETGIKHKFLCGHDERHWFVAAVPDRRADKNGNDVLGVKNIHDAMEALKPDLVRDRESKAGLRGKERQSRNNAARKRQGEWFFVPIWNPIPKASVALQNEPIQRGRAKPHMCEYLLRIGGEEVYVCSQFPNGIPTNTYKKLIQKQPSAKKWLWRRMTRDARVFARGKVSHPDHATLDLGTEWHEVLMNRENEAPSMRHVRFLD